MNLTTRISSWFSTKEKALGSASPNRSWWGVVTEPYQGAWQQNVEYSRKDVLCYPSIFACISLIAGDVSKLPIRIMKKDSNDIWVDIPFKGFEVLQKPNSYQNRIQFIETWVLSKLIRGNAYVLKERDNRGKVFAMHVLHPDLVLPLVSDKGDVFYQLGSDNLAGINESSLTVPASEIIHDRFNCFYHPLIGLSPLYASGLPAYMGMKALENSSNHFKNGARPSGIIVVPEAITPEKASELSTQWQTKYGGQNYGNVAVMGGDIKYQPLSMTAEESQIVELLKLSDEKICSTFHVPPYKIGVGQIPNYNNVQALNVEYLNSALQKPIEDIELCLKEGLDLAEDFKVNIDENAMLRMDSKTQMETLVAAVKGGIETNNEARKSRNKKPILGGDTVWLQQQDYPIEVLVNRRSPDDVGSSQPVNDNPSANKDFFDADFVQKFRKGLINE